MVRVGVIGGGAFGTAMACVMRRSGHDTTIWAHEGVHSAEAVAMLAKRYNVDMPMEERAR